MKKVTLLVLTAISLSSVCFAQSDARVFNEKLVNLQKALLTNVMAIQSNKDSLDGPERLKAIQAEIKRKIEEVVAVKGPGDGEGFKDAMLDSFAQVDLMYDIIVRMNAPGISPEAEAKLKTELAAAKADSKAIDRNVRTEQKKFTDAHHIDL